MKKIIISLLMLGLILMVGCKEETEYFDDDRNLIVCSKVTKDDFYIECEDLGFDDVVPDHYKIRCRIKGTKIVYNSRGGEISCGYDFVDSNLKYDTQFIQGNNKTECLRYLNESDFPKDLEIKWKNESLA